jgi:hypothetical protein
LVTITPGELYSAIALLNVIADTIVISVTANGEEVYYRAVDTAELSGINDFYTWFFNPIVKRTSFVFTDLPAYSGGSLSVNFGYLGETVQVGELIAGITKDIGVLLYGYSVTIEDYSTKSQNDDGSWSIDEGPYNSRGEFTVHLKPNRVYDVRKTLAGYRATPLVWIGHEDRQETIIYGYFIDFDTTVETVMSAYCTVEIEELS